MRDCGARLRLIYFSREEGYAAAVQTFRRVANILRKQAAAQGEGVPDHWDPSLLREAPEQALAATLETLLPRLDALWAAGDHKALLDCLGEVRSAVDTFLTASWSWLKTQICAATVWPCCGPWVPALPGWRILPPCSSRHLMRRPSDEGLRRQKRLPRGWPCFSAQAAAVVLFLWRTSPREAASGQWQGVGRKRLWAGALDRSFLLC